MYGAGYVAHRNAAACVDEVALDHRLLGAAWDAQAAPGIK
jgi:hypothetical protein